MPRENSQNPTNDEKLSLQVQGAKMGLFFGVVNAFQWYANSFK